MLLSEQIQLMRDLLFESDTSETSFLSDPLATKLINLGRREFAADTKCYEKITTVTSTTAGDYALPTDLVAPESMVIKYSGSRLIYKDFEDYFKMSSISEGLPTQFTIYGGRYYFFSTPTVGVTGGITIYHSAYPEDLVDDTTVEVLPLDGQHAAINWACKLFRMRDRRWDEAAAWENEYDKKRYKFKSHSPNQLKDRVQFIKDGRYSTKDRRFNNN